MHPSYYDGAHACLLVFDVTRKSTYKNLQTWYKVGLPARAWVRHVGPRRAQELRQYREKIPCIVVANKIDGEPLLPPSTAAPPPRSSARSRLHHHPKVVRVWQEERHGASGARTAKEGGAERPAQDFHFVSAADGTNVVRVFGDLIKLGAEYKRTSTDIDDEIATLLEDVGAPSRAPAAHSV